MREEILGDELLAATALPGEQDDLTVDLAGEGSKLRLVSLSATTPGGGKLGGSGDVDFAGAQAVNVSITMSHARMINAPIGTAITMAMSEVTSVP